MAFGASITQGFWDTEGGWVQRLRRYYDEKSVVNIRQEDDYPDIFNLGISGNKSQDLVARFDNEASARLQSGDPHSAILFSVGTNNAYVEGNSAWTPPESYKQDLEKLIEQAQKYTQRIMFVGLPPCEETETTPVFWRDISYTNERILIIDKMMREVATSHELPHVATFEVFQDEMAKGRQLFADGLHPNNEGHQLIFELVQPVLDEVLNN